MKRYGKLMVIHERDDVAVALEDVKTGEAFRLDDGPLAACEDILAGHKMAVRDIPEGSPVVKYGYPIGTAKAFIPAGCHAHTHNVRTALTESREYKYKPTALSLSKMSPPVFQGYRRADGSVGVRNEIWVLPLVGCVNRTAGIAAERASRLCAGLVDGVHAFQHPYGCSQMGQDHLNTQRILAGLARHPNAGGVLLLGLGCEQNNTGEFQRMLGEYDADRIKFLVAQEQDDEIEEAVRIIGELAGRASSTRRLPCTADRLVVGLKCGGSDGYSGITANPLVGVFSDRLVACGGSAILTEVPEMFGAETILMERAASRGVFDRTVEMVDGYKRYFTSHGRPVYENPAPGNIEGGITTLEDKSLGCTQKAGSAPVMDVLDYGGQVRTSGLSLLAAPGNDLVSGTALAAAGAHIILFTTGRGTPWGAPVPTVKIATNTALTAKKRNWIDFDAGRVLGGADGEALAGELFDYVLDVASGKQTSNEINGYREIAIFKDGVTV